MPLFFLGALVGAGGTFFIGKTGEEIAKPLKWAALIGAGYVVYQVVKK